jgi:outer membrane protein, heavy metal efflux system
MKRVVTVLCAVAGLSACVPAVRYHPKPIVPAVTARQLESRSLSDPGLRKFIQANLHEKLSAWPVKTWNLKMLSLAALYYSPAMAQARAQVSAAKAAVITAGEKPNPIFRLQPGIPSPWLMGLDLLFPIQTAGKRKIMVEQAQDLTVAALLNLAEAAWKVCSNLRAAMVSYFLATHQAEMMRAQRSLVTRRVTLLNQRLTAGEISRPMVDRARLALLKTRVEVETAESHIRETRATLAAAVGVPLSALAGVQIVWPEFGSPPGEKSISDQAIQRDAVLNRLDVRRALAEYAAAQDELQLQIARQHPNFQIGPGYQFEESNNYFTLGTSVTLPIRNRNQGPIAQAEARRKAAAAAFFATQANAIAQSEEALARYRGALSELKGTENALGQIEHVVVPTERRTVAAGEASQLALNAVLLQRPTLAETWLTALGRAQSALGTLEDAVQRPLTPGDVPPLK